jgi:hypothetical protein
MEDYFTYLEKNGRSTLYLVKKCNSFNQKITVNNTDSDVCSQLYTITTKYRGNEDEKLTYLLRRDSTLTKI